MKMKFPSVSLLTLSTLLFKSTHCSATEILGEIPMLTVLDPINGWSPFTYLNIANASAVPVLVDTGSSNIAVCNTTDMGSSKALAMYGCSAYAGGNIGWTGQLYESEVVFGTKNEAVKDPEPSNIFRMRTQNSKLCTPNLKGIMGVDMAYNTYHDKPMPLPTRDTSCPNGEYDLRPQFASSMMTAEDSYTFGFIGLSPYRNSPDETASVMAFGKTARERVENQISAGTASFSSAIEENLNWYTFTDSVTWELVGVNDDDCADYFESKTCSQTFDLDIDYNKDNLPVVIDSGTQKLEIPFVDENALVAWAEAVNDDYMLIITIGEAELKFDNDALKYLINQSSQAYVNDNPNAMSLAHGKTLGFPVFWYYDIIFDVNWKEANSLGRYGNVTFYERAPGNTGFPPVTSNDDHENPVVTEETHGDSPKNDKFTEETNEGNLYDTNSKNYKVPKEKKAKKGTKAKIVKKKKNAE